MLDSVGATLLLRDDEINQRFVAGLGKFLDPLIGFFLTANQLPKDDVSHGKTKRRKRNRTVAEIADQIVVSSATGDRSQFSGAIEYFENDPGVVSESADNPHVDLDKLIESAQMQSPHQFL